MSEAGAVAGVPGSSLFLAVMVVSVASLTISMSMDGCWSVDGDTMM